MYSTLFNNDQKVEVHKSTKEIQKITKAHIPWIGFERSNMPFERSNTILFCQCFLFISALHHALSFLKCVCVCCCGAHINLILPFSCSNHAYAWFMVHYSLMQAVLLIFWNVIHMCIIVGYLEVVDDANKGRRVWEHSNQEMVWALKQFSGSSNIFIIQAYLLCF